MKYSRLTDEQLREMHGEFSRFLASQSITADEWTDIKKNKPQAAEEEIDIFSDIVWEGVLRKVEYLEHLSKRQLFLFKVGEKQMSLVALKVNNEAINIMTKDGYRWLQDHLLDDQVTIYRSKKEISEDRCKDIFALIKQGSNITKGDLFHYFQKVIREN
jgi:hypothetical protein